MFVAFKPCVEGFLAGYRPYMVVDITHLTGKYREQLAIACDIDGHNWMYPVAYGAIETNDNWIWFMERLHEAVGHPPGLAICTDAGKGIGFAVQEVSRYAEHRECMRHLVNNFKLKFHGKVFDERLWPAAYSWNEDTFQYYISTIEAKNPEAIKFLNTYHKRLWSRSKFSNTSKVDYVTNNLAECFNNWINNQKGLMLYELMDKIRQVMIKFGKRRTVANKLQGQWMLPTVMNELHDKSRGLKLDVSRSDEIEAEVADNGPGGKRHVVNLEQKTCTCRE